MYTQHTYGNTSRTFNSIRARAERPQPTAHPSHFSPTSPQIPDVQAEAALLAWSGHGLGEADACRAALALRRLAAARPWLKAVRLFGRFYGRAADYFVCEARGRGGRGEGEARWGGGGEGHTEIQTDRPSQTLEDREEGSETE